MAKEKKIYLVVKGKRPGIYTTWGGKDGAEIQVQGYPDALYKGFATEDEAGRWFKSLRLPVGRVTQEMQTLIRTEGLNSEVDDRIQAAREAGKVIIFTDGACLRNPGAGGFGVVMLFGGRRKELSGGYRRTTNNRMELTACIEGLKQLKRPSEVVIFSDSKYVVDHIQGGHAARWQAAGWKRTGGQKVENSDLWEDLLKLCAVHRVTFTWVRGHAEYPENVRCDALAVKAARENATAVDSGYEG